MISIRPHTNVLVLTGAGISAESGIRTFRDSGGLWENHRVEDVASPLGFRRDPRLVWSFYKKRWEDAQLATPNTAHLALAELEQKLGDNFHLITQNVDGLHYKAGNRRVWEMHGSLNHCYCTNCEAGYSLREINLSEDLPGCPACKGLLRPDIVWFGEVPYFLPEIEEALKVCEIFLVVGTSGAVYPAAGFVMSAKLMGAQTLAINLDKPDNLGFIDHFFQGKSGEVLPKLLAEWYQN